MCCLWVAVNEGICFLVGACFVGHPLQGYDSQTCFGRGRDIWGIKHLFLRPQCLLHSTHSLPEANIIISYEHNHVLISGVQCKNQWNLASANPYAFMVWFTLFAVKVNSVKWRNLKAGRYMENVPCYGKSTTASAAKYFSWLPCELNKKRMNGLARLLSNCQRR